MSEATSRISVEVTVQSRKLYQVTVPRPYKQAFTLGQVVKIGSNYNPFFAFYETTIEYPVTDSNTGATIQVNAVDWLLRVRAGAIAPNPGILADKAVDVSQHYMMLARELLMEQIRLQEFDGKPPSRQKCLFLVDSVGEAKTWLPLLGGGGEVCELTCTGTIHRADSRLMVKNSEPLSATREKARAYWRGERSADPRMEILFEGDAVVSAVGL
jgi:hypothetical protein